MEELSFERDHLNIIINIILLFCIINLLIINIVLLLCHIILFFTFYEILTV